jgi:hypothetical protein
VVRAARPSDRAQAAGQRRRLHHQRVVPAPRAGVAGRWAGVGHRRRFQGCGAGPFSRACPQQRGGSQSARSCCSLPAPTTAALAPIPPHCLDPHRHKSGHLLHITGPT